MKKQRSYFYNTIGILLSLLAMQCSSDSTKDNPEEVESNAPTQLVDARFTLLSPDDTGVRFSNQFVENYNYNVFNHEYLYNGCGVAAGDVNEDGLPDLYFSSAFGPNRLYINLGNMKFVDVTATAGVAAADGYKTGVTMADVNGDGKMDLYSCRTSKDDDGKKDDFLFIHVRYVTENGVKIPVFEERAAQMGLRDNSNTNHAVFFDFDRDGDLDLFLLNHRIGFDDAEKIRVLEGPDGALTRIKAPQTPFESNRLYRNDNGRFTDITEKAGLINSAFGLSATAVDINQDGWLDLYVANDFIEPDHIYINNRNGTFTDQYDTYLKHSSLFSMGADVADFNNDGWVDIIVVDMKPDDPIRYKELNNAMRYDRYNLLVQYGYGRQASRNVLQLNNGNNTFSEIGQFAGVAATDWSWAPLFADFDNDGLKDVYITNGYRRDVTNLDYMNFFRDSIYRTGGLHPQRFPDINEVLQHIPEKKLSNFLFLNTGKLSFIDGSAAAGMQHPSFSNGAAYADLDGDGDLDIIVNNIDDPAFIYRNDITGKNWLQLDLRHGTNGSVALGGTATVYTGGTLQHAVCMTNKGFLSASDPTLHFGLGTSGKVDSVIVRWPDGSHEIQQNITVNQRLLWKKGTGATYMPKTKPQSTPLFTPQPEALKWTHSDNEFVDFKRQLLLPYMLSAEGPCLAVGDVNGDQLEDVYAGNGNGYPSALFLQNPNGTFTKADVPVFMVDTAYEDCGAVLADFDGDGDLDLMVISGGNAYNANELEYLTRYYTNDGSGRFNRVATFPIIRSNAGAIHVVDFDQDQDLDVIIGGRAIPGSFPLAPKSYLLQNDNGTFKDVTATLFPALDNLGMITDIQSADLDGDGTMEIIFAGEWMPITIFSFDGKSFADRTTAFGLDKTNGWWKSILLEDIDGDGDLDLIAGNMGLNHRLKASTQFPITLVYQDFDGNGSVDPIMCYYHNKALYPFASRDAIIAQIPMLKKKFVRYTPFASATLDDIFTREQLKSSQYLYTYRFETTLFLQEGKKFVMATLPYQAQLSPVYDIVIRDFDGNGRKDLLLGGNFLYSETETGEMDAGNGALLLQQNDGTFVYVPNIEYGFWAQKEVREMKTIRLAGGSEAILTGNNKSIIEVHRLNSYSRPVQ